jgi:hypothetical protein
MLQEMKDALTTSPNPLFRVSEWGVLCLAVGYAESGQGLVWMDQVVIYCPFCGKRLQSQEGIRRKGLNAPSTPLPQDIPGAGVPH